MSEMKRVGVEFGVISAAFVQVAEDFNDGFKAGIQAFQRAAQQPKTPEQREARIEAQRVRLHELRIDRERALGRAYVRRLAADARRDLGLTAPTPRRAELVRGEA